MWHTSALSVSEQYCWIGFETAANCRKLEHNFSTNNLKTSVLVLFLETFETYDFVCYINTKFKSLKASFLLYVVLIISQVALVNFSKYFIMLNVFPKNVNWIFSLYFVSFSFFQLELWALKCCTWFKKLNLVMKRYHDFFMFW